MQNKIPSCGNSALLVLYFRDPEKFSMCFSEVFRLAQSRNFGKKSTENFTGPGNLMLHIQLMGETKNLSKFICHSFINNFNTVLHLLSDIFQTEIQIYYEGFNY